MDGAWLDQSPNEVTLWFGEELVSDSSHFTLFNSRGEALNSSGVDLHDPDHASMTAASPPLTTGIYTVYWQVSLLDGDQTEGTIVFTVGQPDPRETAFYPAAATTTNQSARTAVFAIIALIIIIGGSIFWQRRTR
jgi:methionine-rich copper-binding protein CopC